MTKIDLETGSIKRQQWNQATTRVYLELCTTEQTGRCYWQKTETLKVKKQGMGWWWWETHLSSSCKKNKNKMHIHVLQPPLEQKNIPSKGSLANTVGQSLQTSCTQRRPGPFKQGLMFTGTTGILTSSADALWSIRRYGIQGLLPSVS